MLTPRVSLRISCGIITVRHFSPVRTGISSDIHKFLNVFPHNVVSRLTASPAFFFKSVVSSPVCGITDTEKFRFVTAATVRLIPSMQIEPFPQSDPGSYLYMRS